MTRIAKRPPRSYRSQLRAEQAEGTRWRILEATTRVMARGGAHTSVPAVAREAGVSVPTIYRHFGTKEELLAAVYPHVARRLGFDQVADPQTLDEFRPAMRDYLARFNGLDDAMRAAWASAAADQTRRLTFARRIERLRRIADSIEPPLAEADRDRITRLLVILTTSSSLRMWLDYLGSTVDEAADDLDWVIRAAIASSVRAGRR
jgi:AcrR family transcriptional regulator